MDKLRIDHRAAAVLAAVVLAGSGALAATPAAADGPSGTGPAAASPVTAAPAAGPPAAVAAVPAALPKGKVVSRLPLHIREHATSDSRSLGTLQPGAIVPLRCKVHGQNVDGNDLWYRLGDGWSGYVAARYVQNQAPVSFCR
ncbi:SH3 domain-containing protein [Streptomyces paludis]|uniref:SH3 domain-containing protein n=1 Tax=Streptomyces paludis TaxID=2282738 RepID=A0A345HZM3_9ACTN|nr:SH3 domain-containing protein [Streptomyces paludis]AXG82147.1 SH3 domain-containing protein [Streptomyces paludis]